MKARHHTMIVLLVAAGLAGCSFPSAPPTEVAALPEATLAPTPEQVLEPTATEAPPPTEPGPSPTAGEAGCTDLAAFVADVTHPDDAPVDPAAAFTKVWRLRNAGTCTWTSGYALVLSHGDALGAASAVPLPGVVPPGATADLSVAMTAPAAPGTYQGFWMLRNPSGLLFGVGASGSTAFWVRIVVPGPATATATPGIFLPPLTLIPMPMIPLVGAQADFANIHTCTGLRYATFRVENSGLTTLQSVRFLIEDVTAGSVLYGPAFSNAPFLGTAAACPAGAGALAAGVEAWVAASIGATVPSGHQGRATLRLCTEDSLGGTCIDRVVEFVYP